MNDTFDDLTREIAQGISRRDVFRRLLGGMGGMLLVSLGIGKSKAAVTCGTCQTCDLDTNTCGLPCNPASAGQTLCSAASSDGSYKRLTTYLTTNGFGSAGASEAVVLQQGGQLYGSGLASNFTNSSVTTETATIWYGIGPNGDVSAMGLVFKSGVPIYAINVDSNGRIVQTTVNQTITSTPTISSPAIGAHVRDAAQVTVGGATAAVTNQSQVIPEVTTNPGLCGTLFDYLCGAVGGSIVCGIIGALACLRFGPLAAAVCGILAGVICALPSTAACNAAKDATCACPANEVTCNGMCCGPCMDCSIAPGQTGTCTPDEASPTGCLSRGLGPCCGPNSQCCDVDQVCDNGVCTSPDSACTGAFCGGFTDCNVADDCQCYTVAEGGGTCAANAFCDGLPTCDTSDDCGAGSVCVVGSCCGINVCLSICAPTTTPSVSTLSKTLSKAKASGRLTAAGR